MDEIISCFLKIQHFFSTCVNIFLHVLFVYIQLYCVLADNNVNSVMQEGMTFTIGMTIAVIIMIAENKYAICVYILCVLC